MPYKYETDKLRIPRHLDARVKLSLEDREEIKELYNTGEISQRALARKYDVSRRLISFILFPEKEAKCKQQQKERGTPKYDPDIRNRYMAKHRRRKQELYLKGALDTKGK
jgi:DNA-binding XRE family transcriptional regulator